MPPTPTSAGFSSAPELARALERVGYLADERTALVSYLALALGRPILAEGPPGVGKTELARALATALGRPLIRLQCYEGLDESRAVFEWNYAKQILYAELHKGRTLVAREGRAQTSPTSRAPGDDSKGDGDDELERAFYDERFLIPRSLYRAAISDEPTVLLIDELDRADPELEALLLEFLGEGQLSIPELGTITQKHAPLTILTSNATREIGDALRRRALALHLDYPAPSREQRILQLRVPSLAPELAARLADFCAKVRALELKKRPSLSEAVDFARALLVLGSSSLDPASVESALSALLKYEEDHAEVVAKLPTLLRSQ